ncbi:MAG: ECF transporter S component [Clostridia bacterium]|nr:ECF transporter S component [Clostridia bacterium]
MQKISATKRIVGTAMLSALAYAVSFLEFPVFPAAPFLKLDFSMTFILLAGFLFGPVFGISASAVKELVCVFTKSSTGGIGELANFLVTLGFILIPTIVYKYRKGLKTVVITLLLGMLAQAMVALLTNRFINFPLYMGDAAKEYFYKLWYFILFFNLIKSAAVSVLTILLYKRLSNLLKK